MRYYNRWHQFSVARLLLIMVTVGLALGWWNQTRLSTQRASRIEELQKEIQRSTVNAILRGNQSDDEKIEALSPYIKVGDSIENVEAWAGRVSSTFMTGGFRSSASHDFADCELWVLTKFGKITAFGYYDPIDADVQTAKSLASDSPNP